LSSESAQQALDSRLDVFLRGRYPAGDLAHRIVPLSGDASSRRYFRLSLPERTAIVALYPEPFGEGLPFLELRELFAGWGLPVPEVLDVDPVAGVVVLEDLGDLTMQDLVAAAGPADRAELYHDALETLVRLQRAAAAGPQSATCFKSAFDIEKLSWELHYFEKHFLEGWRGCELTSEDRATLAEAFHGLCAELAAWPRVLCHRDYHSRNLMRYRGRLYWIDFQDARLGPVTYDLVSLLRDSYVDLPEAFAEECAADFRERAAPQVAPDLFRRQFDLMALQRNLKALGTFGFMSHVRLSRVYAPYVPRTLEYVRRNLTLYPEQAGLRRVLARHLEELR
jgi:N-acetylmuramate 1-kinase